MQKHMIMRSVVK